MKPAVDVVAHPGKEDVRLDVDNHFQISRRAVLEALAALPGNNQPGSVHGSRGYPQVVAGVLPEVALALAVGAGLHHNLAASPAAFTERAEPEQAGASLAAPSLAVGAIPVTAARGQARGPAVPAAQILGHLDIGLHAPDGRQEGNLEIIAEIGALGLLQRGAGTVDAEKFLKNLLFIAEPGPHIFLGRGPGFVLDLAQGVISFHQAAELGRSLWVFRVVIRVVFPGQEPVTALDFLPGGPG
jgi:hypothetical protein